jgi:hypothetical protein
MLMGVMQKPTKRGYFGGNSFIETSIFNQMMMTD